MISKVFFLDIYRFYTSRSFQRYQEHQNRSSDDKVMVLLSWSKNKGLQKRRDVENQRHDVENQSRDVAESCRNAASRRRNVDAQRHDVRG